MYDFLREPRFFSPQRADSLEDLLASDGQKRRFAWA
jgi:hypothetical protein